MRDSRILILIVITALGDLSRAGPHKRQMPFYPCGDRCSRIYHDKKPVMEQKEEYCEANVELAKCIGEDCRNPDEREVASLYLDDIIKLFRTLYPPCVPRLESARNSWS